MMVSFVVIGICGVYSVVKRKDEIFQALLCIAALIVVSELYRSGGIGTTFEMSLPLYLASVFAISAFLLLRTRKPSK